MSPGPVASQEKHIFCLAHWLLPVIPVTRETEKEGSKLKANLGNKN
jgi:hypothetical protein